MQLLEYKMSLVHLVQYIIKNKRQTGNSNEIDLPMPGESNEF